MYISIYIITNILLDFAQVCCILLQSALVFSLHQLMLTMWQRIIILVYKSVIRQIRTYYASEIINVYTLILILGIYLCKSTHYVQTKLCVELVIKLINIFLF